MIDVQTVKCPYCGHSFDFSSYVGEEPLDSDVSLTKKLTKRTSWAELDREIRDGRAGLILDVGDTLSFTLKKTAFTNGMPVSVKVAAINGNNVVFSFAHIYWAAMPMNCIRANADGWACSDIADFLEEEVLPSFPDELQAVIQTREIIQEHFQTTYKRESKLWLPSYTEVFGRHKDFSVCDIGDVQFPLFMARENRVRSGKNEAVCSWWLRSPYVSYTTDFWYVDFVGCGGCGSASEMHSICPCFMIGENPENQLSIP